MSNHPLEAAGFQRLAGTWRRGALVVAPSERGWMMRVTVPEGLTLGAQGPIHVQAGLALYAADPSCLAWCDGATLRAFRTLDDAGATLLGDTLEVPVPGPDRLDAVIEAMVAVDLPDVEDHVAAIQRRSGGTAGAVSLADARQGALSVAEDGS